MAQVCTIPPLPDFWHYYYAVIFISIPDLSVNLCTLVDIVNIFLTMVLKLYVVTIVTCRFTNTVLACPLLYILNLTLKRTGFATEDSVIIVTPFMLMNILLISVTVFSALMTASADEVFILSLSQPIGPQLAT